MQSAVGKCRPVTAAWCITTLSSCLGACSPAPPAATPCAESVSIVATAEPAAPPTDAPRPIQLDPYQDHGHRTVNVTVGGEETPFLFDTGGGVTTIVPSVAKTLGCEPFGKLVGYRMRGERLDLARCDDISLHLAHGQVHHDSVGVFDLNRLIPPNWSPLGGMIALSSFHDQVVTIDLSASRVAVGPASTPHADSVPIKLVRQASGYAVVALVPVKTAKGTLWLELDSGSSGALILAPHAAEMLGVDLDAEGVTFKAAVDAKQTPTKQGTWTVPQVSISLPGPGTVSTPAKVMDMIYDGNIGAPLMERFRWTLDLKNQRVNIAPAIR